MTAKDTRDVEWKTVPGELGHGRPPPGVQAAAE